MFFAQKKTKKLVLILAISTLVTGVGNKKMALNYVFWIYYPVWFKENKIRALINLSSKINVISLVYASKLGLKVWHTNIRAQKVNGSIFKTFKIVLASF